MHALARILPFAIHESAEPQPSRPPREINDDVPRELGDPWDVFVPEDDYEPLPENGDFWTEQDAA
jgi:hypothetical protein